MEFADEGREKKCLQSDALVAVDLAERALPDKRVHVFAKCFRTSYTPLNAVEEKHVLFCFLTWYQRSQGTSFRFLNFAQINRQNSRASAAFFWSSHLLEVDSDLWSFPVLGPSLLSSH